MTDANGSRGTGRIRQLPTPSRENGDGSQSPISRKTNPHGPSAGTPNAADRRPSARRRRSGKPAQRRRFFGGAPEQPKSKSARRTRAIKARTSQPASRPASRTLSPGSSSGKAKTSQKDSRLTKANAGAKAPLKKQRPDLPPGTPGHIPPSRSGLRRRRRARKGPNRFLRGAAVLLILGFGIAVLGGTILNSSRPETASEESPSEPETAPPAPAAAAFPVALTQDVPALKATIEDLPNLYPGLTPKVFYVDVDTGQYVDIQGQEAIAAASTIKLPILLAFFQEVDAGRIDPNQTMQIQPGQIADESGDMQFSAPGTQFTALEVATQMIINSDNTATNMMIDLLGGETALNNRFQLMGLEQTQLGNPLPDIEGSNTTSARDLVHSMLLISEGDELSVRSRDRALNILNRTYNDSLLVSGLADKGAQTYNKTGMISGFLGDVALIDHTNGKRYAVAVIVERPANDGRAREMISRISTLTYQEADKAIQPSLTPTEPPENAQEGNTEAAPTSDESAETSPQTESSAPADQPLSPAEVNAGSESDESSP